MRQKQGLIFVISGPSGSGKTTLANRLIRGRELRDKLVKSISFTTRPRRPQEKNGKDYYFISKKEFQRKRRDKGLLEWTRYLGYDYATPKDFIARNITKARCVLLCLDLKGSLKIKRLYPQKSVTIFVTTPSLEILKKRIKKRSKKIQGQEICQRLNLARKELSSASCYDYCVVNKELSAAVKELKRIILSKIKD